MRKRRRQTCQSFIILHKMLSRKSDNAQVNFVITSPGIKQLEKIFNWGRGMLKGTKRKQHQVFTQTVKLKPLNRRFIGGELQAATLTGVPGKLSREKGENDWANCLIPSEGKKDNV